MSIADEFDAWAADGRDTEMAGRHWHTAKHALARMPVEPGEVVLDLGTGSGYAARALRDAKDAGRAYGLDAATEMVRNARGYTDSGHVSYLAGHFEHLPFATDAIDHAFSMEAFYYAPDPHAALREIHRVIRSGGTFYCAVNYYEENPHAHAWADRIDVEMVRWDRTEYRTAFREAGFHVASQDNVPDLETEIPPAETFPTDHYETRADMVERFRELGTLLTVGVVP